MFFAATAFPQNTASISGTVSDLKTRQPVPAASVTAVQTNGNVARTAKSGADGTFSIPGLPAGGYSLCVQVNAHDYLDPCFWDNQPNSVVLSAGQAVNNIAIRLTPASLVTIQLEDRDGLLAQRTRDGRRPDLSLGIWNPRGLYFAARRLSTGGYMTNRVTYQIPVPRDTGLKLHLSSRDLKLGNGTGVALPGNASQEAFQHATGDANPKSFAFTILGFLPNP